MAKLVKRRLPDVPPQVLLKPLARSTSRDPTSSPVLNGIDSAKKSLTFTIYAEQLRSHQPLFKVSAGLFVTERP